jgi:hypothetical protein
MRNKSEGNRMPGSTQDGSLKESGFLAGHVKELRDMLYGCRGVLL